MRKAHLEEATIIPAESALLPIVVHGITGAFFEQKHCQAGRQQFGLGVLGSFLAHIVNLAQALKQVREILVDSMYYLEDNIGQLQLAEMS